ncbi:MAG: VWA domain-containing protein [Gammaproteobacteria bacterium]|nr:VWA domain-containing protein [Gammaproteobacteria bacterium]
MIKKVRILITAGLLTVLSACSDPKSHATAVMLLLDTSGTYTQELSKAQSIINYLLGTMTSGDSFAVARIDSGSFSEKDIVAKMTFDDRPSAANSQKRAFQAAINKMVDEVKSSTYTDISGGMLQAIEFLEETGAGNRHILVFSDMKEEIPKGHIRDFPINFNSVVVTALNVTKLRTDNVDPREYMARIDEWRNKVESSGGSWRVINDLDHVEELLNKQ